MYCPLTERNASAQECEGCRKDFLPVCDYFFLIAVGSRTFEDYNKLKEKLDFLLSNKEDVFIVSGGARGADRLAVRYAVERGHLYREFPADWDHLGKKAGYVRNRQMHEFVSHFQNRGCVLFWDGKSPGTKQNIPLAEKFGTPLKIVDITK